MAGGLRGEVWRDLSKIRARGGEGKRGRGLRTVPTASTIRVMKIARVVPALLGLCGSWLAGSAAAQTAPSTPPASAAAPIHLDYVLYSHGLHVMNLQAEITLAPQGYAIRLHDQTTGMIGMLIRSDVTSVASGRFDGDRAVPVDFASSGTARGADRVTRIAYVNGAPQVREVRPIDPDRDRVPVAATDRSIDGLSAMVELVHTVAATGGCNGSVHIFDGIRLSSMTARTIGPRPMPVDDEAAFHGTALRCDFTGLQLGGFLHNADEALMRQPQNGTAWLQTVLPDAPPLPVRVTFSHPHLGMLTILLATAHR